MRLGRYLIPQAGYPVGRHIPSGNDNVGFVTFGATMLPWRRSHLPYFSSYSRISQVDTDSAAACAALAAAALARCLQVRAAGRKKNVPQIFFKSGRASLEFFIFSRGKTNFGGGV